LILRTLLLVVIQSTQVDELAADLSGRVARRDGDRDAEPPTQGSEDIP
jgi:hypothetical protein